MPMTPFVTRFPELGPAKLAPYGFGGENNCRMANRVLSNSTATSRVVTADG